MKTIKTLYIILLFLFSSFFYCCTDILNTSPRDTLTDELVWSNEDNINIYIGKLYDYMETEDFSFSTVDGQPGFSALITDEAVRSYTWGSANNHIIPNNGFAWWEYVRIRDANSFLEKVKTAPLDEKKKILYESEVRFIRSFYYFSLVKRYGGVPLITEVQDYTGNNISDLQVPRNTEIDIYKFICKEIDEIINILPEVWDNENRFRVTKYGALALKSRAMLYAASIATYGKVELKGLVGIPFAEKDYFWNESKKASEMIINSGKFSLYSLNDDKVENYQSLFLDKTLHSEAIFTRAFLAPERGHSFDFYNAPQSFKINYGCVINPVVELVENFEYIDGSKGLLRVNDEKGIPIQYSDPTELFIDKDPRLLATIMTPFTPWQGGIVEIRKGIIDGDKTITASNLTDTYGEGENSITIVGKDGPLDINDPTKTGFYIKKFMNPTERLNEYRSDTYWMVFRYAEILLNYAEACFELGEIETSSQAINQIRKRAGIAPKHFLTLDDIRNERKVELAFENHRWWDLRRWRIADKVLNNWKAYSLNSYLVWESGKHPSEMKYIFKIEPAPKNTRTFLPELYYVRIDNKEIMTNPNLVQNPGY